MVNHGQSKHFTVPGLVNVYIAMDHAINGSINYKWQFSKVMSNFQRVSLMKSDFDGFRVSQIGCLPHQLRHSVSIVGDG